MIRSSLFLHGVLLASKGKRTHLAVGYTSRLRSLGGTFGGILAANACRLSSKSIRYATYSIPTLPPMGARCADVASSDQSCGRFQRLSIAPRAISTPRVINEELTKIPQALAPHCAVAWFRCACVYTVHEGIAWLCRDRVQQLNPEVSVQG